MKYKNLLILSILSTAISLTACGSNASDISGENTETEIVASADTETETTEETSETEKIESTEIADTEVESTATADTETESTETTDTETIVSENTENETETVASGEFTDTYEDTRPASEVTAETCAAASIVEEYGSEKAWGNIARENGADGVRGYYWYYKNGKAAGDKPSYLVYMREGSPYYGQVFQYGDTLLDGTTNLNGTNAEYDAYTTKSSAEKLREQGYEVEDNGDGTYTINFDK
jgi:hypothetical protein